MTFCGAIEMVGAPLICFIRRHRPTGIFQAGIITLKTSIIKGGVEKFALKQPIFMPSPVDPMYSQKVGTSLHLSSAKCSANLHRSSSSRASASTFVSLFFLYCEHRSHNLSRWRRQAVQHGRVRMPASHDLHTDTAPASSVAYKQAALNAIAYLQKLGYSEFMSI